MSTPSSGAVRFGSRRSTPGCPGRGMEIFLTLSKSRSLIPATRVQLRTTTLNQCSLNAATSSSQLFWIPVRVNSRTTPFRGECSVEYTSLIEVDIEGAAKSIQEENMALRGSWGHCSRSLGERIDLGYNSPAATAKFVQVVGGASKPRHDHCRLGSTGNIRRVEAFQTLHDSFLIITPLFILIHRGEVEVHQLAELHVVHREL